MKHDEPNVLERSFSQDNHGGLTNSCIVAIIKSLLLSIFYLTLG
jgi:hypothetical protein